MRACIVIPHREGFQGYWLLGRHFDVGTHEVEVTEAEFTQLKVDPVINLLQAPPAKKTAAAPTEETANTEEATQAAPTKKRRRRRKAKKQPE